MVCGWIKESEAELWSRWEERRKEIASTCNVNRAMELSSTTKNARFDSTLPPTSVFVVENDGVLTQFVEIIYKILGGNIRERKEVFKSEGEVEGEWDNWLPGDGMNMFRYEGPKGIRIMAYGDKDVVKVCEDMGDVTVFTRSKWEEIGGREGVGAEWEGRVWYDEVREEEERGRWGLARAGVIEGIEDFRPFVFCNECECFEVEGTVETGKGDNCFRGVKHYGKVCKRGRTLIELVRWIRRGEEGKTIVFFPDGDTLREEIIR